MADLLQVEALFAGYGEAVVLSDIGFSLADGQSLALLGRNGTGKTTLINSIVGLTTHKSGSIRLDGHDIARERPERRVAAGVGWSPQERNIFRSLTVEENLTAVARPGVWSLERVFAMFPRLLQRRGSSTRASYCWTSRSKAWHPLSSTSCWRCCARSSARKACRRSSSSRRRERSWALPIEP